MEQISDLSTFVITRPKLMSNTDLLFRNGIIVESLRQWAVLLTCSVLMIALLIATSRIFKTDRRLSFNSIIIAAETIRVIMILVYEFAFDHLIMLLYIFLVETILRAIVCSNFVS